MKKRLYIIFLLMLVIGSSGCARREVVTIKDVSGFYETVDVKGAPNIVINDFADFRKDKKNVGKIWVWTFESTSPLNAALADRIAVRLKSTGFNVKKTAFEQVTKSDVRDVLEENSSRLFVYGKLNSFYFSSPEPITKATKGETSFYAEVADENGNKVFGKEYTVGAKKCVGFDVKTGAGKLIELNLDTCVDTLFGDEEFVALLEKDKKAGLRKKEPKKKAWFKKEEPEAVIGETKEEDEEEKAQPAEGEVYSVSEELERIVTLHDSGDLTDEEFKKAKEKVLE
ncbi:MAG: SHOCT domain-containing protein [Candidatus Omnitrophica bacterium]|nr:SHOCT domain-containing protein [Candidatus Omnitrophota bacterium]